MCVPTTSYSQLGCVYFYFYELVMHVYILLVALANIVSDFIYFLLPFPSPSLPPPPLPPPASPRSLTCRCEGPHFCKEGNRTCDLDPGKGHVELFCVSYKVFYDDGVVAVGATCKATEISYFLFRCQPPKQVCDV